ncbi:MAG: hypothetical protein AAFX56_19455 [Pseudomonadota bacterium]
MNGTGRFLEFAVRAPDILSSLSFYKSLGFTEIDTGDVYDHKYAVVSDGDLNLGLHDLDQPSPRMTFVQPDIAKHARSMLDHGFEFSRIMLDDDVFNQLELEDPDRNVLAMLEARTFNLAPDDTGDSACGTWFEMTLPVRDTIRAARFWAAVAPKVSEVREEPTMHMRFDAGGAALGLSESIALEGPSLCFKCDDRDELTRRLQLAGIEADTYPGFEGAFARITAPEGTPLYLFPEDFLGEAYEVEESDDLTEFPR